MILFKNNYYEDSERLFSTGDEELDDLLEEVYYSGISDGYDYFQKEFAQKDSVVKGAGAKVKKFITGIGTRRPAKGFNPDLVKAGMKEHGSTSWNNVLYAKKGFKNDYAVGEINRINNKGVRAMRKERNAQAQQLRNLRKKGSYDPAQVLREQATTGASKQEAAVDAVGGWSVRKR